MNFWVLDTDIPITYQDNLGRLSAVLYITKQCNLNCVSCFNKQLPNKYMNSKKLKEKLNQIRNLGVEWIVISGGEPTLHVFLFNLVYYLKKEGFYVRIDTNGLKPCLIEQLIGLVDGFAVDIKIPLTLKLTKERLNRYCKILYNTSNYVDYSIIRDYQDKSLTSARLISMCEYIRNNSVFRTVKYPYLTDEDKEAINYFADIYNLNHIWLDFVEVYNA